MSFPRYENYKDSGVEWLGDVPEHWDVKRLKQVCEVFPSNVDKKTYENETPVLLCNYTDVYYNENITPHIDFMAATASADQIKKFTLRGGDTIITKDSETADDIAIAAYVPQDMPGVICGYHLSMIRPREATCGAFMKRLFDSIYVKSCCAVYANGLTRVGLGQYALDNLEMPFPPKSEQQTIAAFLDCETAKIDALITEQQRLIELLKEKRQAVISHAITTGLNPDVPMKDSGVEWLGEVPEHWETVRLGALFKETAEPGNDELPVLSVSIHNGVSDREFEDDELERKVVRSEDRSKYKRVKVGDLVYNMMRAWQGGFGTVVVPGMVSPAYVVARPTRQIRADFIEQLLRTQQAVEELRRNSRGVTDFRLRLYWSEFKPIKVALPSIKEQHDIMEFLDRETAKFDELTTEAERAINFLQEHRMALISAAVTGKIDVRRLI
ncbi:MAG: restriction endonuclease subunit S [Nitrosomonas sp.]|uniref:restriction endonuclease subunit S n=1 Tax=Nitrosomonas sp. TaxID=42353 RepID=UPI00273615F9|nr:restriction endonuclease subunit S [Nitrosomonas sp.]MDP3282703.1 restriction endonuclease subunit S [Nitrosomonas sp.]MDP3662560.1 restriction endonuclease subunit S [Nitrosomonas sp.]MDZ4105078.1 restriction endonuclease subunit S [Nitrosomonas sp.]HRB46513.1 restriction endonuclease subunit S [Nitrosomonas sp.]